jgi:hypothetical protein
MSSENINLIDRTYKAFEDRYLYFGFLSREIHVTQCPQVSWGGVFQADEAKLFFGR